MSTRTRSLLLSALLPSALFGQSLGIHNHRGGIISLGVRSSISAFNHGEWNNTGTGVGGQLRVQLADRVNTDWFFDYLSGNIGDFAHREDLHIGWSVLFYVLEPGQEQRLFQPYVLAGHCFDRSLQKANEDPSIRAERWSSAVQAGIGTHINLSERSDLSLVSQYMIHLGADIHADQHEGEVEFHEEGGSDLEGHLLFHLSFNYKLFDLW